MHPQQQYASQQQQQSAHFTQGPPPNMLHHQSGAQMHDGNNFSMNQPPPNHQLWNNGAPPTQMNIGIQQQQPQTPAPNGSGNQQSLAITITAQIEAINMQQNTLREQIRQSESNLTAQHTVNVIAIHIFTVLYTYMHRICLQNDLIFCLKIS